MAKGYGIEASDWVLVLALAGAGYLIWKSVGEPVSEITHNVSSLTNNPLSILSGPKGYDELISKVQGLFK